MANIRVTFERVERYTVDVFVDGQCPVDLIDDAIGEYIAQKDPEKTFIREEEEQIDIKILDFDTDDSNLRV